MNGKIIMILIFACLELFGKVVSATVDKPNIIKGDSVTYSISASGENVVFPNITSINNCTIDAVANSNQFIQINAKKTVRYTKSWSFYPDKNMTIPSYKVIVDGKAYHTKPIKLVVLNNVKGENFKLELDAPKKVIVGSANLIRIKFYQKTNASFSSASLELPTKNLDLKPVGKEKIYYKGAYKITEIDYLLVPKKEGNIDFKVGIKLGFAKPEVDSFGFLVRVMRYKLLQKDVHLIAKKVGSKIVGDYNISLKIDKQNQPNQPINGELIIKGQGDLSILGDIKLNIPNATVYGNKPKVTVFVKDGKIYSIYKKSFVILADKSFEIAPIQIQFYSTKKHKLTTIQTKPVFVKINKTSIVKKNLTNQNISLKQKNNIKKKSKDDGSFMVLYLFLAFVGGVICSIMGWYI